MRNRRGGLLISLDYEGYWGVRDKVSLAEFRRTNSEDRSIIYQTLELFARYNIHATWAIVGMLFCKNGAELLHSLPDCQPLYKNKNLSPYVNMEEIIQADETENSHLFAPSEIGSIAATPHQEIASHTFSHYYCLEEGQESEHFKADLQAAVKIARAFNLSITSLVFPRNQINPNYLPICRDLGIKAYRGHHPHWIYQGDPRRKNQNVIWQAVKFMDLFVNLSGHGAFSEAELTSELHINIPASRFLRGYTKRLRFLKRLRLHRIKADLTYAGQRGLIYHLWWHPHDFATHKDEKFLFLRDILEHFTDLKEKYEMESLNMAELTERI